METTEPTVGTEPTGEPAGTEEPSNQGTDYEAIAREKGWRPKEEYEGDGEAWVGAEEFIKRQPLFDKIKVQSKELKELKRTVEALAKHYQTNIQQAKERAILDLKAERREAIELGEVGKVEEIDQKIEHVQKMEEPVAAQPSMPSELETFLEEQKSWFNKDEELTAFAVAYNESYLRRNPGNLKLSLDETLKAVQKAFPDKFENKRKQSPPPVEGAAPVSKGEGKYSINRLNAEQKLVYKQLVQVHKQLTHEQYFKSLDEAGYLEA